MATEFQRRGASVVISSRSPESIDAAVRSLPRPEKVLGVPCDVRDLEQVEDLARKAAARFGAIDIWINNAGLAHPYLKLLDIEPTRWQESFETNLYGASNGCRVALQNMLPRHKGQIVNILGMGADRPSPNQSGYGASKAAVWQLTRTLAQEYAGSGISIYAVQPGMSWTEMLTNAEGVDEPRLRARMEWAMRVFGNPPEVPARFVAERAASGDSNGKLLRVLTPRLFVPRMIGEMLGRTKANPRPWEQ